MKALTIKELAQRMLDALVFIVNDTPESGEDAQLTTEGYNRACAAIALAKAVGMKSFLTDEEES